MALFERKTAIRAEAEADEIYDRLRADHGEFSPKASGYLSERFFLRERTLVLKTVAGEPGVLLDVACGSGLVTLPLAQAGRRVIGVDFNAAACREAKRNGLEAVRGDAFSLPLADAAVGLALNVEFIQQYRAGAVDLLLQEAARVLAPAGRLVIVWSNRRALVHQAATAALRILSRWRGQASMDFPLHHHSPAAMWAAGKRAGFRLERSFAVFPPLRLRLNRTRGLLVGLIGSSFVAVFQKRPQP